MKQLMKISEEKIGPGYGIGIDEKGDKVHVVGGDLCYGKTIEVTPYKGSRDFYINSKVDYEDIQIFSKKFDKDGLIKLRDLKEVKEISEPGRRVYEIGDYWVFIDDNIHREVEYIYNYNLEEFARVKITNHWSIVKSGAAIYSVNFIDLLEKVLSRKKAVSAWYFCEKDKDFNNGVYADLYILANLNEGQLQIQLWQIIGNGDHVQYIHGILDNKTFKFKHLDLATHIVDPIVIPKLLEKKERMELIKKEKWLRLDGVIEQRVFLDLTKMFFPYDQLINEFTERPLSKKTSLFI